MNPVIRAYEARIDDINGAERSIVAKISTQDIDRYNTVFLSRGCDVTAYNNNRVVLWCHGKDPQRGERPIGKNQWIRVDRGSEPKIIAKTIFNDDEFSQQLFRDYQNGFLNAWSISILPTEFGRPTQEEVRSYPSWSKVETVYRKFDVLEYSACGVPGNSNCISINENEVRDLCEMVSRGYYIFPEVKPLVERMNGTVEADPETEEAPADETPDEEVATDAEVARDAPTEDVVEAVVETEPEAAEPVVEETVERSAPEAEPIAEASPEPEKEVEPEPVVEPAKPELPPLVGRTLEEVVKSAVDPIGAFERAFAEKMKDLQGWLRGEA